jgi:two-component system sensor histidine kinase CpxA
MRSLFLKIFAVFLLSHVMLFTGAFLAFRFFANDTRRHHPERDVVRAYAVQAATIYEREGEQSLQAYLRQLRRHEHVRGFLLDAQGHALGKAVPPMISRQITRYPQWIRPHANRAGPFFLSAVEVHLASDTPYRFIAVRRPPPHWRPPLGAPWIRWGLFLATTMLASALIAALFTRPLRRLRTATRQFAEGDLTVRAPVGVRQRADAIGELGREFDRMAARIEKLIDTQGRLLRDVSHELRSPLARMQIAAALAEERVDQDAAEELARIQIEIHRLDTLIESLLTLTRLESGASQLVMRDLDLVKMLDRVVADADYEYRREGKRVQLEAATHVTVSGDQSALRSAFENVLRNALRYTANDTEVTVLVAASGAKPSTLRIQICDHGPGVPEADLTRLFDPFFRSDKARHETTGSHGIGLAIARAVMERHHGQIQADNRPEGGLCVTMTLPQQAENLATP